MKNFELSNIGKKTLLSHAAGKKHSERYIKIKAFFKPANQKKITNNNTEFKSAENSNGSSSSCNSPKTANSFRMGPDKLHYYVTFGLASYFKSLLTGTPKKSDCTNDLTQTLDMDLLVRFFDNSTNIQTLLTPNFMIVVFYLMPLTKIYINSLMIYQMN